MSAPEQRGGLRSVASGGSFDVGAAVGGPRGVLDAALPSVLFVIVYSLVQELRPALWAAVGVAAVLTVVRLARRESLQSAVSGLLGVALCAFVATRTGRAEDFFLPGLLINVAYATAYLVSILVRWPLLGVFVGPITGEWMAWRQDPARLRAYTRASWIWVGVFVLRLAVQGPLYAAGMVGALGTARVLMGFPLFGLAAWLSWLVLRRVPLAHPADPKPDTDGGQVAPHPAADRD